MLLKRLEAYGFKSFADKLEVEFDEGVTAIVGPNGSGKSNITDAIRWVLGEQNVRNLRGTKAEDVIFNGSSTRRALGMAEVSLTFDNSDGTLPLDYQEIMITRRIHRTGESEFYINKSKCRLKDIFTLFADTGLGKNSLSVISQNKVDEVLNTKPDDRRYFFEECAGITKYRDRKKESKRKLESTGQNLIRLKDIFGELEKQLTPLREQAEKTTRYNEIHDIYDQCKITNILHGYEALTKNINEETAKVNKFKEEQLALETTVNVSEADKLKKTQAIHSLEKELKELKQNLERFNEEVQGYRNRSTMLEERLKQTVQAQEKVVNQAEEAKENHTLTIADLAEAQRKTGLAGKTADALTKQLKVLQDEQGKIENKITELEEALKSSQESEVKQRSEIQEQQQILIKLQRKLADVEASIGAEQHNYQYIVKEQIEKNSQKELLKGKIEKLAKDKIKQQREIDVQKSELNSFKQNIDDLTRRLQEVEQQYRGIEEKVKLYQGMQKAYEGFGKATKKVLTADEKWSKGICGAVAELISVDEQFVTAIDVALGSAMQNIVVKDTDTAKAAIKFLQSKKYGRVTFMPLTTVQNHSGKREVFEPGKNGFIAYADELVDIDSDYRIITQSLLGRILVVDDIDNALKMAKLHNYRLRIVTLNGELLHPGGSLSGGSTHTKETGFLQRAGELAELKDDLAEKNNRKKDIKANLDENKEKYSVLSTNFNELQSVLQQMELQYAQRVFELQQIDKWFEEQKSRTEAINNHISALEIKKTAVNSEVEEQKNLIVDLENQLNRKQEDYSDAEAEIKNLRDQQKIAMTKVNQKQISVSQARQEYIHFQEEAERLKGQGQRYQQLLDDLAKEKIDLQNIIDDCTRESKAIEKSNLNLKDISVSTQRKHDKIYQRLLGMRSELEDMANERSKIAGQVSSLKDKMHKCELVITKLQTELKQMTEELQKNYDLTPEMALQRKLDMQPDDVKKELKKLEKELEDIGPVNPNAINEFEALNERYSFMQQQIEDLLKAKADLEALIEQIDKKMASQFKEAFEEIKVSFNTIFQKLFGGGRGSLILTDPEDMLNTGIEIQVEPPDKKPLSMASLSGGERTLTVIALLFAFFSYNPAPFSVLDEIDAPLDEANVKRFAKFLNSYAENTQFILVTHRKGTMESANTLYGVTIEDAGVSKLISVRLDDFVERE